MSSHESKGGLDRKEMFFFFQAKDGIRDAQESRGLGDVYKRQTYPCSAGPVRTSKWLGTGRIRPVDTPPRPNQEAWTCSRPALALLEGHIIGSRRSVSVSVSVSVKLCHSFSLGRQRRVPRPSGIPAWRRRSAARSKWDSTKAPHLSLIH